jgi:signal transduction histidine kinase
MEHTGYTGAAERPRRGAQGGRARTYDFRETLREFSEEITRSLTLEQLGESAFRTATGLIPVERIGFFTMHPVKKRLRLVAHAGYDILRHRSVPFEFERLHTSLHAPVALERSVEAAAMVEPGDGAVFRRWGISVAFPLLGPAREVLGFLVLGPKTSGEVFTAEEIDLLGLLTAQAALATARINLQERLLVHSAENERLEELNRIKSDFVSSVSHELKTPLTSIKMMAEMLLEHPAMAHTKIRRYAGVIEGESERLTRLINNILEFSKIERGVKEYAPAATDLNRAVRRVLEILSYPLAMESFTVTTALARNPGAIRADADALCGALMNLLSNAMKYSAGRREIAVSTFRRGPWAGVAVRDHGIGIAPGEREAIFDPFFRSKLPNIAAIGGVGLGLTLVKHCMDAHGGTVAARSAPGGGTAVTLLFPLMDTPRKEPA